MHFVFSSGEFGANSLRGGPFVVPAQLTPIKERYYLNGGIDMFDPPHPPIHTYIHPCTSSTTHPHSYTYPHTPTEFPFAVPYVTMRGASALCGSLLVPCVYQVCVEGVVWA